jgi:hypothetical protein
MAFVIARFDVPDFDTWKKESFDADLGERKKLAKGHRLYRGVAARANNVLLVLEFPSVREARTFRRSLEDDGFEPAFGKGLENPRAWISEEVEALAY